MATPRPARSEPHLTPEEAAQVEAQVRGYFDSVAPRRPAKPPRSDPSEDTVAATDGGSDLPELRKLRDLEAKPQRLVLDGGGDVDGEEEYVETRYYDGLNCIDKQHHTTGTGFIKVGRADGSSFSVTTAAGYSSASFVRCKSNPATNDWIPSSETVIPASNKPSRSDS